MKIVLAEKVSPATLAVFQSEAGWKIVTHDQIKNGLGAELADAVMNLEHEASVSRIAAALGRASTKGVLQCA